MVDRVDKDAQRRIDHAPGGTSKPTEKSGPGKSSNITAAVPQPAQSIWMFTKHELLDSPSTSEGISAQQETSYRRTLCGFMQDAGIRLKLYLKIFICLNIIIDHYLLDFFHTISDHNQP